MLHEFRVKNFRSFQGEAVLDFRASAIKEHEEVLRVDGGEKILPVAAIYGPNASGKSNLLTALVMFFVGVNRSLEDSDFISELWDNRFLLSGGVPEPMEFYLSGTTNEGNFFEYSFSILNAVVYDESLIVKKQRKRTVFSRRYDESAKTASIKTAEKYKSLTRLQNLSTILFISILARVGAQRTAEVAGYIASFVVLPLTDENALEKVRFKYLAALIAHEDNHRFVRGYMRSFDPLIYDIRAEDRMIDGKKEADIITTHKIPDTGDLVDFRLSNESAGTIKMLLLCADILRALSLGHVMIVDELPNSLHPLLFRFIVTLFRNNDFFVNGREKRAQLIFTAHDLSLMDHDLLRRDEIWFTQKDEYARSELYSLADFVDEDGAKVRKDSDYAKNYLLGRYDAIPDIEGIYQAFLSAIQGENPDA